MTAITFGQMVLRVKYCILFPDIYNTWNKYTFVYRNVRYSLKQNYQHLYSI